MAFLMVQTLHQPVVQVGRHLRQRSLLLSECLAQVFILLYRMIALVHDCSILMILHSFFLVLLSFEAMVVGMLPVTKAISFKLISS